MDNVGDEKTSFKWAYLDGRLGGVQFSRVGAFHKNDAIIYYNGNSEDPDDARSNSFNLWDED